MFSSYYQFYITSFTWSLELVRVLIDSLSQVLDVNFKIFSEVEIVDSMRVIFFLYFHFARQAFDVFDQQCIEIWDFFFKNVLNVINL